MVAMEHGEKKQWLLAIIGASDSIEGNTRLQKYCLLASKLILKGGSAYDDWRPYKFGAWSNDVRSDVESLQAAGLVKMEVTGDFYDTHVYELLPHGRSELDIFVEMHPKIFSDVKTIISYYRDKDLDELLADVYSLFPEYTAKSTIMDRVMHAMMKRSADASAVYSLPYTDKKVGLQMMTGASGGPPEIDDREIRAEIAKMIGLPGVPPINPDAFKGATSLWKFKPLTDSEFDQIMAER
ncbi:hypothetical protein IBTHAUMO2_1030025 [Nitrosopumilaceae archaeon]|nr:hypothetical protein IBTHAUMO2_1030025 [Nitrosopumilaceae archaeon]